MGIKNFDKKEFDRAQKSGGVTILQFWSAWCGDCFDISHLENIQQTNKVSIFRVNFEDNEELADLYSVKITPSYLFFRDFKVFAFLFGVQTEKSLKRFL